MTGARRSALYADRKAARRCVDCAAGLQETDRVRCIECAARAVADQRRYRRSKKGVATERARQTRRYADRRAAGQCVTCAAPAAPGRIRCDHHLTEQAARQAMYLDRREEPSC